MAAMILLATPLRIDERIALSWIISRDTFNGRSAVSIRPAHEAKITGQELGLVGDEDPLHVELHAALSIGVEEVEGLRTRG